jgi:ATP-dependent Clp protease ATP-binding subunit ClpX
MNQSKVGFKKGKEKEKIDKDNFLKHVSPHDMRTFGLIPELIGRLPVLVHLDPLDRDALRSILLEPKNALLKQYKKIFKADGITLTFEDEAIEFLVDRALEFKLGARGLRSICEVIMTDAMYDLPSETEIKEFAVTREFVEEKLENTRVSKLKVA